ncbi:hypothetical protein, partial [Ralstonia pickettii]|uniref:hypothetical protein n=1 Tax=Ralstonia pickettii TaxID=329 RepID=UPI002D79913E
HGMGRPGRGRVTQETAQKQCRILKSCALCNAAKCALRRGKRHVETQQRYRVLYLRVKKAAACEPLHHNDSQDFSDGRVNMGADVAAHNNIPLTCLTITGTIGQKIERLFSFF